MLPTPHLVNHVPKSEADALIENRLIAVTPISLQKWSLLQRDVLIAVS